jgi:hypothetical protein
LAKAATWEVVARMKELLAAEQVELRAKKQAVDDEAQRIWVERLAVAATTKAAKVVERARKIVELQEQQHIRAARAMEMAQGGQGGSKSVDAIAMELEVPPLNTSSSILEQFPYFPAPQNLPYFLSSSVAFPPMTSPAHLSFQQLNTPMQSTQPSHQLVHISTPFQVFQNSLQHSSQWTREISHHHGQEHH